MKKMLYPMLILGMCFPILLTGQKSALVEVKCSDFACNIDKAQTALANKLYKEAIDYCRTAKTFPDANVSEADAVIYKILESIVAQKNIAEGEKREALAVQKNAVEEESKALAAINKAKSDAETASNKKENANAVLKQADNEESKALEAIKKADIDIEMATHQKEKAKLAITQAQSTKAKAKDAFTLSTSETQTAIDLKKQAEREAEAAKLKKEKAEGIIANSEKATLAATNLVKEVSNALSGEERKEEKPQEYVASKSVEQPNKKEVTTGGIYITSKSPEQTPNRKIDIMVFQKAIDAEKDKVKAYKIQDKLIDSLEIWSRKDTIYRADLAENYANKAWSALFLRKYDESEIACRMGLKMDANKPFIKAILGHALLFQGDYDQALGVYIDFLKDPKQHKSKTNRQRIIEDLEVLKQGGITHKDVTKITSVLVNDKKMK